MQTTYPYFEDEEIALDDADYTRAVFRNCRLTYSGGELKLDGARFIDCQYAARGNGKRAEKLQRSIFASLYAEGIRVLHINAEGEYATEPWRS